MNTLKTILVSALVAVIVTFVGIALVGNQSVDNLGAATRYPHGYLDTADGYYVDGTAIIDGSGNVDGNITTNSLTVGSSGTAITSYVCTSSAVYNPGSVASTTIDTATTSLTGAALGDAVIATIATTTQGLVLSGYVSATNEVTSVLSQPDNDATAVNIATTTLKWCLLK